MYIYIYQSPWLWLSSLECLIIIGLAKMFNRLPIRSQTEENRILTYSFNISRGVKIYWVRVIFVVTNRICWLQRCPLDRPFPDSASRREASLILPAADIEEGTAVSNTVSRACLHYSCESWFQLLICILSLVAWRKLMREELLQHGLCCDKTASSGVYDHQILICLYVLCPKCRKSTRWG